MNRMGPEIRRLVDSADSERPGPEIRRLVDSTDSGRPGPEIRRLLIQRILITHRSKTPGGYESRIKFENTPETFDGFETRQKCSKHAQNVTSKYVRRSAFQSPVESSKRLKRGPEKIDQEFSKISIRSG